MSHRSALIFLFGIALILNGCSSGKKVENNNHYIPVRISIVSSNSMDTGWEYVGVAEGEVSSLLSFPTIGTIEKMYAVEGQRVAKGALLAELGTSNLQNTYAAAKAVLAQVEDAMERIQMLYDNESVPEIKYIEIQTELEKARSMEAIAGKNLEDSRLTAPFSGIIGQKNAEAGENVSPNQPVYTLLRIDQAVMIKVSVPEKEISRIRLNQPATITVSALDDEMFEGTVSEKGVVADPISHTYGIRIRVNNADQKLLPGMVCNVVIHGATGEDDIIVLANNCVQKSGNGQKFVWLVVDGNPVKRPVQTGRLTGGGVEITSGLRDGEEVITEGYQNLFEGATVRVL